MKAEKVKARVGVEAPNDDAPKPALLKLVQPSGNPTLEHKRKLCGAPTAVGKPCRQTILPCARHTPGLQRQPKSTAPMELIVQGMLQGKSVAKSASDANYSKNARQGISYRIIKSLYTKEQIQECLRAIHLDCREVIGTLVSHMRVDLADFLPESEILRRAREKGISHLIKKLKTRTRLVPQKKGKAIQEQVIDIEVYSSLEAIKELCKIFGLRNLPPPQQSMKRP